MVRQLFRPGCVTAVERGQVQTLLGLWRKQPAGEVPGMVAAKS
ncbi:hypothetical protein [Arthrobacter glacialis]|nr:hypothetical protein [Arthrobacter glacialis]